MNQHYDNSDEENSVDLEKRLAAYSLVSPSTDYPLIPHKLLAARPAQGRGRWHWLTAGVLACSVAALTLYGAGSIDSTTRTGESLAQNPDSLRQNDQSALPENRSPEPQYMAGTHYLELADPIDVSMSTSSEVVAFFWYPCWPCSEFEEHLGSWENELGDDVSLTRIPAIWSTAMRFHARAYYTAQALGVLDKAHRQLYIQFKKDSAAITNEEGLQQYFATIGISRADFLRAYNAESTLQWLERAEAANMAYQIQSTPSLFVAGKYAISPASEGGFQEMLNVTDYLIEGLADQSEQDRR